MVELTVCIGTSCHLRGSEKVIRIFKKMISKNKLENSINLKGSFCLGKCSEKNVLVRINDEVFETVPDEAETFFLQNVLKAEG